mmetsp:Transcript_6662/g.23545  ORF Transcript_6662/g.23545 Transcript_6662/m.23545 type:complete len:438 (-) Transcript_6662:44-1357(-)
MLYGMFVLWMGWYGFNCGSTLGVGYGLDTLATHIAATTTLAVSGAVCFCSAMLIRREGVVAVEDVATAGLGGLVAITPACADVELFASFVIGGVGGCVAIAGARAERWLRLDDPCAAVAVHGLPAVWGLLSLGLFHAGRQFSESKCMREIEVVPGGGQCAPDSCERDDAQGIFYGGSGRLLWVQLVGVLGALAWATGLSAFLLLVLGRTIGIRVPPEVELDGLDLHEHGYEPMDDVQKQVSKAMRRLSVALDGDAGADGWRSRGRQSLSIRRLSVGAVEVRKGRAVDNARSMITRSQTKKGGEGKKGQKGEAETMTAAVASRIRKLVTDSMVVGHRRGGGGHHKADAAAEVHKAAQRSAAGPTGAGLTIAAQLKQDSVTSPRHVMPSGNSLFASPARSGHSQSGAGLSQQLAGLQAQITALAAKVAAIEQAGGANKR